MTPIWSAIHPFINLWILPIFSYIIYIILNYLFLKIYSGSKLKSKIFFIIISIFYTLSTILSISIENYRRSKLPRPLNRFIAEKIDRKPYPNYYYHPTSNKTCSADNFLSSAFLGSWPSKTLFYEIGVDKPLKEKTKNIYLLPSTCEELSK